MIPICSGRLHGTEYRINISRTVQDQESCRIGNPTQELNPAVYRVHLYKKRKIAMDFSVQNLEGLGQAERIRLCRQMRKKQVENYLEFVSREQANQPQPSAPLPRKPNARGTKVHFHGDVCLQTAVEETDEKEVMRGLHGGSDYNFSTGNGTSLLHKCCAEGSFAIAELLVLRGADVNCSDDDWWTPLHVACYQDNADIVQLLLVNGADVSVMDVDGQFPIDHVPSHSDTWDAIISFMESKGLSAVKLKKLREQRCHMMEKDIKAMIRTSQDLNSVISDDGVTLLHMAAANGYLKCAKLLLKNGADSNAVTNSSGWTPLHCAAKFGQAKMVNLLIKFGADTSLTDKGGQRPIDLASDEDIQKMISEVRVVTRTSALLTDDKGDSAVGTDDEEDVTSTKIIRPSHLPLSKVDRLMEGQMLLHARSNSNSPASKPPAGGNRGGRKKEAARREDFVGGGGSGAGVDDEEDANDDVYEIFATSIYSTAETLEGQLPARTPQDDLSSLPSLTERIILETVLQRYADKIIYTYMGDLLIAVNPFTDLPIYGKWASELYRKAPTLASLPPHVYAIAEHAQRRMRSSGANQCCIINGESGSGKTETSKLLVQHLMCSSSSSEHQLNSKLHQINPLLEAFGNAQTIMNSNSSRFAKFLELVFSTDGCVLGGYLHQYLLEKSRVVHQSPREGNFHIFSWLVHGATPEERAQCMLESTQYRYLQSAGAGTVGSHAQQKFLEVRDCMNFVGFSQDDTSNMLTIVAAVLHLGDVTFRECEDGKSLTPAQPDSLRKVCRLLRVPYEDLSSALTEDILTARGEELRKPLTQSQCRENVDALSKALYSRLFAWIVNGVNQMVAPLEDYTGEKVTIGVLDIFGFENLEINGFEQMCINVANERLQQFYQAQVFEQEQQECESEGVTPVKVTFPCSQQVLNLFMERNTGIYDLVDEESTFPKATDETLATKLHYYLGKKHDNVYKMPRYGGTTFTVLHYAGAVEYSVHGVIDKNRDTLRQALAFVMRSSESLLVKELFQSAMTKTGSISPSARQRVSRKMKPAKSPFDFFKKLRMSKQEHKGQRKNAKVPSGKTTSRKTPTTLTYHFKNSLSEMLSRLESCVPSFIRCIKPNPRGNPLTADTDYVCAQLRYSGVLQTAVLRKQGFAVRCSFDQFVSSYLDLTLFHGRGKPSDDVRSCVINVITSFDIPPVQVGRSKVFLRLTQAEQLDIANTRLTAQVITVQAVIRRFLAATFVQKRRRAREEHRQLDLQREMEKKKAEDRKSAQKEMERQQQEEEETRRRKEAEEEGKRKIMAERHEEETQDEEVVKQRSHPDENLTGLPKEVRQSLDFLDAVISEYSDQSFDTDDRSADAEDDDYQDACSVPVSSAHTTRDTSNNNDNDDPEDESYRDASSLRLEPQQQQQPEVAESETDTMPRSKKGSQPKAPPVISHPFLPHELPMDSALRGASFLPSPREMYSSPMTQMAGGFNHAATASINGHSGGGVCAKRVPPQVPERSPDTQLSSGRDSTSRKSSISSKDSCSSLEQCSELNDVFEPNHPHHPYHPHYSYYHQGTSTTTMTTTTTTNSSSSSKPFSYAAGIDARVLQQQQRQLAGASMSTNGGSVAKGHTVPEAYPSLSAMGDAEGGMYYNMPGAGFQPYGAEHRRVDSKTPSTSSSQGSGSGGGMNGVGSGVGAPLQEVEGWGVPQPTPQGVYQAVYQGAPQGSYQGMYQAAPQTYPYDPAVSPYHGAPWSPTQTVAGSGVGYAYPASPGHHHHSHYSPAASATHHQHPPHLPPPSQMYSGAAPARSIGVVPPPNVVPGGGSPRHVHTHHHIVTKPHPSPPASRRASNTSPSRSPGSSSGSAFQPVSSSALLSSSSSSSVPSQQLSSCSSTPQPPPSFPAPPPPLPLHDRYLAATQETRSPSPPLPPPPPSTEFGGVPPPPSHHHPPSSIPSASVPVSPPMASPGTPVKGEHQPRSETRRETALSRERGDHQGNGDHMGSSGSRGILTEVGHVKLKKTERLENSDTRKVQQQLEDRSQSPLGVRLKPTVGKFSHIYQEQSPPESVPEELPPPPLPEAEELPTPPAQQCRSPAADAAAPPTSLAVPTSPGGELENQIAAAVSKMEIDIPDDIDLSQCPGLVEINQFTPNWKREMIEKKNKEKIEEYVKKILKERESEAKWRNVPEWKRALLMKKDQEDQAAGLPTVSSPDKKAPPPPPKGNAPTPLPKPKGDIVPAALSIDPAELESMPPWKRELLFKREKVPITFSNEFNPDEDEQGGEQPNQS